MPQLFYGVAKLYVGRTFAGIQIYASCYVNKLFNYGCKSIFVTYDLALEEVHFNIKIKPDIYWIEETKYLDHAYLDNDYDDDELIIEAEE